MNLYEVTFVVDRVPDALVDDLIDDFDATTGHDHAGRSFVTLVCHGDDFVGAAKTAYTHMQTLGLCVQRLSTDLASRSDIAARLGVTRQAVYNWTKGNRLGGFPQPVNPVNGGVWLWGDVHRWAVENGHADDIGVAYPTQDDLDLLNGWIVGKCRDPWQLDRDEPVVTRGLSTRIRVHFDAPTALAGELRSWHISGNHPLTRR